MKPKEKKMTIVTFTRLFNKQVVKWNIIKFNNREDALLVCENLRENGYVFKIESQDVQN